MFVNVWMILFVWLLGQDPELHWLHTFDQRAYLLWKAFRETISCLRNIQASFTTEYYMWHGQLTTDNLQLTCDRWHMTYLLNFTWFCCCCINLTVRKHQKIQCLPYVGFSSLNESLSKFDTCTRSCIVSKKHKQLIFNIA